MIKELYSEACETKEPQHYTFEQAMLAISLACYTSNDDLMLNRREFLLSVRDRIDLDLLDNTY